MKPRHNGLDRVVMDREGQGFVSRGILVQKRSTRNRMHAVLVASAGSGDGLRPLESILCRLDKEAIFDHIA